MATTEYTLQTDSHGFQAVFKVKYEKGIWKSVQKIRGKLSEEQYRGLMQIIPENEKEIPIIQLRYENRLTYKKTEKQASLHSQFTDIYLSWYHSKFEISPILKPQDFAALKWIKDSIRAMSIDDDEAVFSWEVILNNWDKQDSWYQQQTELIQIKRNFNTILKILKHGKFNEQGTREASKNSNEYRDRL